MSAKAALETMTKALSESVSQNPGGIIAGAGAVISWGVGTAVATYTDSIQKQRDRDSQAEQRQRDRDSQAEQRQRDRDSQEAIAKNQIESNAQIEKNKIVENELNREAIYAAMNRSSLETAERAQNCYSNGVFRNKDPENRLIEQVEYYRAKDNKTNVSETTSKEIEISQLPSGSSFIPSPLDQPEYPALAVDLLQSIYKMLILWF